MLDKIRRVLSWLRWPILYAVTLFILLPWILWQLAKLIPTGLKELWSAIRRHVTATVFSIVMTGVFSYIAVSLTLDVLDESWVRTMMCFLSPVAFLIGMTQWGLIIEEKVRRR